MCRKWRLKDTSSGIHTNASYSFRHVFYTNLDLRLIYNFKHIFCALWSFCLRVVKPPKTKISDIWMVCLTFGYNLTIRHAVRYLWPPPYVVRYLWPTQQSQSTSWLHCLSSGNVLILPMTGLWRKWPTVTIEICVNNIDCLQEYNLPSDLNCLWHIY